MIAWVDIVRPTAPKRVLIVPARPAVSCRFLTQAG
jgi:hypothetical protein